MNYGNLSPSFSVKSIEFSACSDVYNCYLYTIVMSNEFSFFVNICKTAALKTWLHGGVPKIFENLILFSTLLSELF